MTKSLTVWGLCALMSAGSILSAGANTVPAAGNADIKTIASDPGRIRSPWRFEHRRDGRFLNDSQRQIKCRKNMFGRDGFCMGFRPGQRTFCNFFKGHYRFMPGRYERFDICRKLIPTVPMNEDEMAKFAGLKLDLCDALQAYRTENSNNNVTALRTAVDKLVSAAQQYEIERCEKALARAKDAVAQKSKIVERTMKKFTAVPPGRSMRQHLHRRAAAK